jgi:hypothetical protein
MASTLNTLVPSECEVLVWLFLLSSPSIIEDCQYFEYNYEYEKL